MQAGITDQWSENHPGKQRNRYAEKVEGSAGVKHISTVDRRIGEHYGIGRGGDWEPEATPQGSS